MGALIFMISVPVVHEVTKRYPGGLPLAYFLKCESHGLKLGAIHIDLFASLLAIVNQWRCECPVLLLKKLVQRALNIFCKLLASAFVQIFIEQLFCLFSSFDFKPG